MKHLYFVRHGLSEANKEGRWAGRHTETPLAPEGRLQAEAAGKEAKLLGIDHIISSPQSRAHETAQIIASTLGLPAKSVELNSLFVERGYGVLEGTPWKPDMNVDGFADVETTDTLLHRMYLAHEFLLTLPHDVVLVVGHGAAGRALRHIIHPHIPVHTQPFPNAQIVQLI